MTSLPPEFSIITATLNREQHLVDCLDSVRAQRGVQHEHIVIDGGSTDGSVSLLKSRQDPKLFWQSEADLGIGDAMNKGIARARGEWLLFLHSDDYLLATDSLYLCLTHLQSSAADIVGFPIRFGLPEDSRILKPRGDTCWLNLKTGLLHQATFIRNGLFARIGGYDAGLRITMDYEFFLRARRSRVRFATFEAPTPSFMRSTGISSQQDWHSLRRRFAEERCVHLRHAPGSLARLFYSAYWPAYLGYRWLLHHGNGRGYGRCPATTH